MVMNRLEAARRLPENQDPQRQSVIDSVKRQLREAGVADPGMPTSSSLEKQAPLAHKKEIFSGNQPTSPETRKELELWIERDPRKTIPKNLIQQLEGRGFPVKERLQIPQLLASGTTLGQGRLSEVTLVRDPATNQQVALKTINRFIGAERQNVSGIPAFWNEADILSETTRKKIPGIIPLLGLVKGETIGGYAYPALLLEPLLKEDGWTKWTYIEWKNLPASSAVWYITQVIKTVRTLEKEKIWLDDFKGDNVFVKIPKSTGISPETRIYDLQYAKRTPKEEGREQCQQFWMEVKRKYPNDNLPTFEELWKN